MGNKGSNAENDIDDDAVPVILHVYQPGTEEQSPVGMVYHSGVEVFGSEYFYGGGGTTGTGIMVQKPKSQPRGTKWEYYRSEVISKNIELSRQEVRELLVELRKDWKAKDYHLTKNNCNHFSDALVKALCGDHVSIPGWVNRLARMGNALMGSGIISEENKQKLDNVMTGNEQAKQGTQPVIEYVPESKTVFLLNKVNLNECGALNLSEQQSASDLALLFTQNLDENAVSIRSENDEQLLLFIPFSGKVKLEAIGLALPFGESCPMKIKLFAGKSNMDFDDAETMKATKTIHIKEIPEPQASGDDDDEEKKSTEFWSKSFPLKLTKFRNITFLTLFVESNHGDDVSALFKIEFWGQD